MLLTWGELITNFLFAQQIVRTEGSCASEECTRTAKVYAWHINYAEYPCHDFFDYSCGDYSSLKNNAKPYVNTFSQRNREIDKKIQDFLFEYDGPGRTDPNYSHVYSFYQGCKDITTVQRLNFQHIENELKFIGLSLKWPFLDKKAPDEMFATEILARLQASSVGTTGFLFKISVEIHDLDSNIRRVIKVEEPSDTILQSIQQYKFMQTSMQYYLSSVILEFHKYLEKDLTDEESEIIEFHAIKVSEFLYKLKEVFETPREFLLESKVMSVKDFQGLIDKELAGGMIQLNWKKFLQVLYGLYNQSVESIVEPTQEIIYLFDTLKFKKMLRLLQKTSPEILFSAMWWTAIDRLLYQFAHPFHQYHKIYDMYRPMFLPIDRTAKCMNWVRRHFPLFVAHVLATEKDSSTIKSNVEEMVTNIKTSFSNGLRRNKWLSWKTKNMALKKFKNMKFIIGYTDSILESSNLAKAYGTTHVDYENFIPILCELFRKERKNNLLLLFPSDAPIDALDLNTPDVEVKFNPLAQSVGMFDPNPTEYLYILYNGASTLEHFSPNALKMKLTNIFTFIPISILRFPFYHLGLDVLNYGAVGVQIAYGIARAFDSMWIKPSAKNLVECLELVFGTLSVRVIQSCVDGDLTLFSNIADAIAFRVSMEAYKIRVKAKGLEQTLPVYNYKEKQYHKKPSGINESDMESSGGDENNKELLNEEENNDWIINEEKDEHLFIKAYVNSLCEVGTTEYYKRKSESGEIPLNRARVNGVLTNTNIFARKWDCGYETWMNPQQKCKVWN